MNAEQLYQSLINDSKTFMNTVNGILEDNQSEEDLMNATTEFLELIGERVEQLSNIMQSDDIPEETKLKYFNFRVGAESYFMKKAIKLLPSFYTEDLSNTIIYSKFKLKLIDLKSNIFIDINTQITNPESPIAMLLYKMQEILDDIYSFQDDEWKQEQSQEFERLLGEEDEDEEIDPWDTAITNSMLSNQQQEENELWQQQLMEENEAKGSNIPLGNSEEINDYDYDEIGLVKTPGTCWDSIMQNDENIEDYLKTDSKDNIFIIEKPEGKGPVRVDCYTRSGLLSQLKNGNNLFYECKAPSLAPHSVNKDTVYFMLTTTVLGNVLVKKTEILGFLNNEDNYVIILEKNREIPRIVSLMVMDYGGSIISSRHCEEGVNYPFYKIYRCGGDKCLKSIL